MVGNPGLARALGIPVRRYASATFVAGTCLAALAGVLIAPLVPVQPFMGLDHILMSFFVLVVGGLGSVAGLVTGSTLIGGINSVVSALSDSTGGYSACSPSFFLARPRASMRVRRCAAARVGAAVLALAAVPFAFVDSGLTSGLSSLRDRGARLGSAGAGCFLRSSRGSSSVSAAYLLAALTRAAEPGWLLLLFARRLRLGPARVRDRRARFRQRGESGPTSR